MNQIQQNGMSRRNGTPRVIRQSSLAGAVRTALMASGIALMGTSAVYAQSCNPASDTNCSAGQTSTASNVIHDLTVVGSAAPASAVTSTALAADNAAITQAAASTLRLVNRNNITRSQAGTVIGLNASLDDAIVTVINEATVDVTSTDQGIADGIFAAGARTDVTNNGEIKAAGNGWTAGIESHSTDSLRIRNNGDINATYLDSDTPLERPIVGTYGIFSKNFGNAGSVIDNRGSIVANGAQYSVGIFAYDGGTGGLRITNSGDISARTVTDVTAAIGTGIFASTNAPGGDIVLNNSGTVAADAVYRGATGIAVSAIGEGSKATITNSGSISAEGLSPDGQTKYSGTALNVLAGGDVAINNTAAGEIFGKGAGGATAVRASSAGGNVRVTNAGLINATPGKYSAQGVVATADVGRVDFTNSGTLIASGRSGSAVGALIRGAAGAAGTNSGLIDLAPTGSSNTRTSIALYVQSSQGDAVARNAASGTIRVKTAGNNSLPAALWATADVGNSTVTNAGALQVESSGGTATVFGAAALSADNGNATNTNTGSITVGGTNLTNSSTGTVGVPGFGAVGMHVQTSAGTARATNQGTVVINAPITTATLASPDSVGVLGIARSGGVNLTNSGSIRITAPSTAVATTIPTRGPVGMDGRSDSGTVSVTNNADIQLSGLAVTGLRGSGKGGDVTLRNAGTINAAGTAGHAAGISGTIDGGSLVLRNTGSITAATQGGDAFGILGTVSNGSVQVNNSGSLLASSVNGDAYGILIRSGVAATIDNTGSITATTAIQGSDGNNTITNRGSVFGAIITGAGNDTITNAATGTWNLAGSNASFGSGDDSFRNQGALLLSGSQMAFGSGNNTFTNSGTIKLAGNNTVQLGGGADALFTNTGVLDFVNGKVGDNLTIAGNFAGKGNINMDVNLRAAKGDYLYISGVTLAGTQQKLNVALLDGLPTAQSVNKPLQLVQVAGSADPKAFIAGQVLGVSPADFLKLDMSVAVTKEASSNGGNYLLAITPKVVGLNAVGTLASAAAMGVDSLLSSTTGNWRDRDAMIQASSALPGLKSITPWVRGFRDTGGMSPSYMAGNFGQAHSASLNQDNMGSEVGFNLDAGNGLHFGATVAKSEAKQYLANGYGMDTLRGSSAGMYMTWRSQGGAYVDASVRGMQFDAYMDTLAGRQESQGTANMLNLETGHTWTLRNGLNLEPQFQYTSTTVSGMNVQGHQAAFETETTNWQRGRIGLSMWKSYRNVAGWNVTPFGQVNAVHTLEGTLNYNVNRDFYGQLNGEGTNALVKMGLNASKGRLAFGSALNWQSGNTVDSGLGVQTRLSYAW